MKESLLVKNLLSSRWVAATIKDALAIRQETLSLPPTNKSY